MVQMKGEFLILVTESADGLQATVGVLPSLVESQGTYMFSLLFTPGRSMCVPASERGAKRVLKIDIRDKLQVLDIRVQADMRLRLRRPDHSLNNSSPLAPHYRVVTVACHPL